VTDLSGDATFTGLISDSALAISDYTATFNAGFAVHAFSGLASDPHLAWTVLTDTSIVDSTTNPCNFKFVEDLTH
jgi:hypothetical protein